MMTEKVGLVLDAICDSHLPLPFAAAKVAAAFNLSLIDAEIHIMEFLSGDDRFVIRRGRLGGIYRKTALVKAAKPVTTSGELMDEHLLEVKAAKPVTTSGELMDEHLLEERARAYYDALERSLR
jgi:hypothetical protein